jgi:hypothetical protein
MPSFVLKHVICHRIVYTERIFDDGTTSNFHDYYSGRKVATMLTITIGGNREASDQKRKVAAFIRLRVGLVCD